jgi:3-isopropylmalate/(R)-2-methylmalate dehydratase large subunit
MGKTLVEKVISQHCEKEVQAGDYVLVNLDLMYMHDVSAPRTIDLMKQFGMNGARFPNKTIFMLDHSTPAPQRDVKPSDD